MATSLPPSSAFLDADISYKALGGAIAFIVIDTEKWYRIACKVLIFLLTIHFCAQLVTTTLQCVLLSRLWNLSDSDGHCVDIIAYYRWSSIPCTIEDVLMLLLPIPVILKLQLPRRDKFRLFLTFSTASIGVIASLIRLIWFLKTNFTEDVPWTGVTLVIVATTETGSYFIAACLPSFRQLLVHLRRRRQFTTFGGTAGSNERTRIALGAYNKQSATDSGHSFILPIAANLAENDEENFVRGEIQFRVTHDFTATKST